MPSLLDPLLVPQRLAVRAIDDFQRIADAAGSIAALVRDFRSELRPLAGSFRHAVETLDGVRDEFAALRAGFELMSDDDLDALRGAFAATTDELQKLQASFTPELAGVHGAADGLHDEVRRQRELIDKLEKTLRDVGQLLETGMAALVGSIKPVVRDLDEIREVIEPLQSATERVGRMAERIPGPGRKA